jgi:hypothetical protein
MSRHDYPFLYSFYSDDGWKPDQELLQKYTEATQLKFKVATQIIDLLKAGRREFPTLTVPDPTETLEFDLQMVPQVFEAVTYKDLLYGSNKTTEEYRAHVDMQAPYRDNPGMYRRVGALEVETHPISADIDVVSLSRGSGADEVVYTSFVNRDSQEALGFIGLTAAYLDALPK